MICCNWSGWLAKSWTVLVSMLFHDALVQRAEVTQLHIDTAFTFTMGTSVASWFARTTDHPPIADVAAGMADLALRLVTAP